LMMQRYVFFYCAQVFFNFFLKYFSNR